MLQKESLSSSHSLFSIDRGKFRRLRKIPMKSSERLSILFECNSQIQTFSASRLKRLSHQGQSTSTLRKTFTNLPQSSREGSKKEKTGSLQSGKSEKLVSQGLTSTTPILYISTLSRKDFAACEETACIGKRTMESFSMFQNRERVSKGGS